MADRKVFANQGPTKPNVDKSLFDLSHANNLTARLGRAYPVLVYDAPAGSSFRIKPRMAFDLQPLMFPIQTPIRAHLSFFKIPKRILMKSYKDFIGQHGEHKQPWIARPAGWASTGSLADYMGIPTQAYDVESDLFRLERSRVFDCADYETFTNSAERLTNLTIMRPMPDTLVDNSGIFIERCERLIDSKDALLKFQIVFKESLTVDGTGEISQFVNKDLSFHLLRNINAPRGFFRADGRPWWNYMSKVLYNFQAHYRKSLSLSNFAGQTGWTCPIDEMEQISTGFTDNAENPITYTRASIYVRFSSAFVTNFNDFAASTSNFLGLTMSWEDDLRPYFGDESHNVVNHPEFDYKLIGDATAQEGTITKLDMVSDFAMKTYGVSKFFQYKTQVAKEHSDTAVFSTDSPATAPKLPINALPFRAYEFIGNYFFRNERVTPFKIGGVETFNQFITTDADGADSSTPVDFWNAPYEYDLFTTCVPTPQFGNAPLVGITTNDLTNEGVFHMVPDGEEPYDIGVKVGENSTILGITNYEEVADKSSVMRLKEAVEFGISINDFRNVNCLQRFQERYMKAGTKYQNIVYEFFGTNPPIGEEFPEYIGGCTSVMNVGKIVNQTGNNDSDIKLGEYAGIGNIRGRGNKVRCFCAEESYIMGILWFTATPTYSQMLPRLFTKFDLLEFFNPLFANIGLQPVYTHQLAPLQLTDEELTDVFGYNRPFSEYVSMQDEVHGEFRSSMANFLMQRIFGSKPQLGADFLYIKPEDLTDVFSVNENDDKIFGQIWFDIKAKLPIPRFAIPRII